MLLDIRMRIVISMVDRTVVMMERDIWSVNMVSTRREYGKICRAAIATHTRPKTKQIE